MDNNWSPQCHWNMIIISGFYLNDLFEMFFLRLEERKIISLAHQMMFEDMLGFWTIEDSKYLYLTGDYSGTTSEDSYDDEWHY